jgi:methionyl-tRNA formyltransferase
MSNPDASAQSPLPASSESLPPSRLKILLLGHGRLAAAVLTGLLQQEGVLVVGVFGWNSRRRKRFLTALRHRLIGWLPDSEDRPLQQAIRRYGCPRWGRGLTGANDPKFLDRLIALQPDIILVASWGEIIRPATLSRLSTPLFNCHPSLLPAHRGANPFVSVIRSGERQTGVTFHQITAGIDTGPILFQSSVPVYPDDTGGDVRDRCAATATEMMPEVVRRLRSPGDFLFTQPEANASYFPKLEMSDATPDWLCESPEAVVRHVRALQPWMAAMTFINGRHPISFREVSLLPAVSPNPQNASPGTVLRIDAQGLWLQSATPEQHYCIPRFQLYWGLGFLPERLSVWLARRWFRAGQPALPYWEG